MAGSIRVLVAAEEALTREGVRGLLQECHDIELIAECTHGKQAVDEARNLKPDVVVMESDMKVLNGFEATRRLSRESPNIKVIMVVDRDTTDSVAGTFLSGAKACILKPMLGGEALASAIRAVHGGEMYLHPSVTGTLLRNYLKVSKGRPSRDPYGQLTDREKHVLRLVAEGLTGPQIARHLNIAVKTACGHRAKVMKKLGIHTRSELIKYAIRRGIVQV